MAQFKIYPVNRCSSCGKSDGSGFAWHLTNDAGTVIARSFAPYPTSLAARSDIDALRGCANTPVVDTTGDSDG